MDRSACAVRPTRNESGTKASWISSNLRNGEFGVDLDIHTIFGCFGGCVLFCDPFSLHTLYSITPPSLHSINLSCYLCSSSLFTIPDLLFAIHITLFSRKAKILFKLCFTSLYYRIVDYLC
ncbi:hypothetical protein BLNAU_4733 [Blattamonas nauphoetae]|uniref:Uncharacterized protein n=1 Tax=Blattamonas nauphoetae TaxID=2049346 RepID=A0ABQ9Y8W5_9EUKA|nr:hypothetical protein BLNAU_4733 [Blattamonas nauphoetae]